MFYKELYERQSQRIITSFHIHEKFVNFDDFIICHRLNSTGNIDLLKEFYNSSIRKLTEYDEKNKTNLIETLEIYFKCKGVG